MAITVDYGPLGVADFPDGITEDELNRLAGIEFDRKSEVEARRQEQIRFNSQPYPELFPGYKYIDPLVRANAPMLSAFAKGTANVLQAGEYLGLTAANFPVEQANLISPELGTYAWNFTQPLRIASNIAHEVNEGFFKDVKDVPSISPETWTQAWREGPATTALMVGEKLAENTPQIGASIALIPLMASIGVPMATARIVAPMVMTGILEAAGSTKDQLERTGQFSPRSSVAVGIVGGLMERYGLSQILEKTGADRLLPTEGLVPGIKQVGVRAAKAFGREAAVESGQAVSSMNIPPAISDQPWIPLREQGANILESAGIGGLLGASVSTGIDANTLSANRILWDENLQDAVRQKILAEDEHRARAEAILRNPPPVMPPPMESVVPAPGTLSSSPYAFPPPVAYWDYSDPFSPPPPPAPPVPPPMQSVVPAPGALTTTPVVPAPPAAAPAPPVAAPPQDDQHVIQAKAEADKGLFFDQEHQTNWINRRSAELRASAVENRFGRRSKEYVAALQAVNAARGLNRAAINPAPKENPLAAVPIYSDPKGTTSSLFNLTGGKFESPRSELGLRAVVLPNGQRVWIQEKTTVPEQLRLLEVNTKAPAPAPAPEAPAKPLGDVVIQEKMRFRETIGPGDVIELRNKNGVVKFTVQNSPDGLVATDGNVTFGLEPRSPNHFFRLVGAVKGTKTKLVKAKAVKVAKTTNALRPATTESVLGRTPAGQSVLSQAVKNVVAPIADATKSALRVVSDTFKGGTARQSEAVNKEAGNRFSIPDKVVEFLAKFKALTDAETNPAISKAYNDILVQFSKITERVDGEFNQEHENVIGQATAQKIGAEAEEAGELPTHRPEFLSEYHQMIVNQVNAAFVSYFDKTLADAHKEFGNPEDQQGTFIESTREKIYKQVNEKLKKWNLSKAYSNARNKAYTLYKDRVAKPVTPAQREAKRKAEEKDKIKVDRAVAKANKDYFNQRNPWGGLSDTHKQRVRYYITRLYNNLPLVQRYGVDQVSPHDEGRIDIENIEPYDDYLTRTQDHLNEFRNLIGMGDKNNPYLSIIFLLIQDKPTIDRIAKPPDLVKELVSGKKWKDLAKIDWAPLDETQRNILIRELNVAFGEKVAAKFKVDPEVESEAGLKEWRLSLNATQPANPEKPMELEDLVVVLDKIFGGMDRRPGNVYVGTNEFGAVATASFTPNSKNRQRVTVDLNLAKDRGDLEDRVREEILHMVYDIRDPIFRRTVTHLTPAQIKEMQDLYYNRTFDESYQLFKEEGHTGPVLMAMAYARTRSIVDEEAALRVLIAQMKNAKPGNAAVNFWTKISSKIRNQFGLKVTPREAALTMERSVNRFLKHEQRWQDRRLKNNAAIVQHARGQMAVNPDAVQALAEAAPDEAAPAETRASLPERDNAFYTRAYQLATERGLTVNLEEETTGEVSEAVRIEGAKARRALEHQKGLVDALDALRNCVGTT